MRIIKLVINLAINAVGILLLFSGVLQVVYRIEENSCDMTYMFEYPEYIPVHLDTAIQSKFPKYTLMLYGEGTYAADLRRLPPSGIPVLFIPGNAGSHKQVRSLGSVALRKTEGMDFHFNFFAVDFMEELTALRGSYLLSQTKFVHECIKVILKLYRESNANTHSLVLIGHSMGGVVARGLFTLQDFDKNSVSTIIALASPNLKPPVMVDQEMLQYYSSLNALWNSLNRTEIESMMHLVFVSIGGGSRDIQVHSNLIPLGDSFLASQSFSVIVSAIPKVWLSTDHRCIVWCKQLVLAIVRALIDLVDDSKYKVVDNATERLDVLRYHLFSSFSAENSFRKANSLLLPDSKVDISLCKLVMNRQYFQSSPKLDRNCFLLNITKEMKAVHIVYIGTFVNWIGECESVTKCELYSSYAKDTEIIRAKNGLVKVISIHREKSFRRNRIVLMRLSDPKEERIYTKISYEANHTIALGNPLGFANRYLFVRNERTFLRVELPFMHVPWLTYRVFIAASCKHQDPSISAKLRIPWLKEDIFRVFSKAVELKLAFNIETSMRSWYRPHLVPVFAKILGMHHDLPSVLKTSLEEVPELLLWFNSKCDFDIKTYFDFVGTTGQLLKFSYEKILRWVIVFSLLHFGGESGFLLDQITHYGAYVFSLVVFSIFNLQVICLEGFAMVVFDMITGYCIVSLLHLLACILISFSKYAGYIIVWTASLPRKYITFYHASDKSNGNIYIFYAELLLIIGLQFVAYDCVALIIFIAICTATGSLAKKEPKTVSVIGLQICLRLPSMVTWLKERQDGYPTDFDVSSSTMCVICVIGTQIINYCHDRETITVNFVYKGAMYAFGFLLLFSNTSLYGISRLLTMAIVVYCMICKQKEIRM